MAEAYNQRLTHQPSRVESDREYDTEETIISLRDQNPGITLTQQILQYLTSLIGGLLLIRFLLALFGANAGNAFVRTVYEVTNPLVEPFRGLFTIEARSGAARFEIETLIATIVYILLGLAVIRFLDIFRKA